MKFNTVKVIPSAMLLGVILGAILGYLAPEFMLAIDFLGRLFVSALKVIIIPLIFATLVVGVASLGSLQKIGRTGVRMLGYFLGTSAIAIIIGLVLVSIIKPGAAMATTGAISSELSAGTLSGSFSIFLASLIPDSLVGAVTEGRYLGLIIAVIFLAGVLGSTGSKGKTILSVCRELSEVIMKLVGLILYAAPIGLFSLIGSALARNTDSLSGMAQSLGLLALTLLVGLVIHAGAVLPAILTFLGNRSPIAYLANNAPALYTALGTASSSATLPVTYECVVNRGGVDSRAGSLVLPVGMVMNLNGSAMYVVIATVFVAQVFGVTLGWLQLLAVGATTLLVSLGMGGIPFAGSMAMAAVLAAVGLPLEGVSLVLAVEWLLDRFRTPVNVWAGSIAAAVIAETFEFKTARHGVRTRPSTRPPRTVGRGIGERVRSDSVASRRGDRRSDGSRQRDRKPSRQVEQASARRSRSLKPQSTKSEPSPFDIKPGGTPPLSTEKVEAAGVDTDERAKGSSLRQSRSRFRTESSRPAGRGTARETTHDRRESKRDSREQRETARPRAVPAETDPMPTKVESPDRDAVARDLANISAQLKTISPSETGSRPSGRPESAQTEVPSLFDHAREPAEDTPTPQLPSGEVSDDGSGADSVPDRNADEPVGVSPQTDEKSMNEEAKSPQPPHVEFGGRSRYRQTDKPKPDPVPSEDKPASAPEVKDSFTVENGSYGRGKKKRSR